MDYEAITAAIVEARSDLSLERVKAIPVNGRLDGTIVGMVEKTMSDLATQWRAIVAVLPVGTKIRSLGGNTVRKAISPWLTTDGRAGPPPRSGWCQCADSCDLENVVYYEEIDGPRHGYSCISCRRIRQTG